MASFTGRVLLTGANGFVASQVLSDLIDRNYHVIATVRSQEKGQQIIDLHPAWKEYITFIYVSDMIATGAYDEAFKLGDIDYIIHTASPVSFDDQDIQKDLIDPAIGGTMRLVEAAQKNGGHSLKRFILLGSGVSIVDTTGARTSEAPYTEADWNPITAEFAIERKNSILGYVASKTLGERAAWKFMAEHKPSFDLVVLNPAVVIGPMLQPISGPQNVNMSNASFLYSFFNGQVSDVQDISMPFTSFVDVRDLARAHILALTTPAAANKRIILVSGKITPHLIVKAIKNQVPELNDRVAKGGDVDVASSSGAVFDTARSFELFGPEWGYRDLETSVRDTARDLLAWEKKWGNKI